MSVTLEDLQACSEYEAGPNPGKGEFMRYWFKHPDPDHSGYVVKSNTLVMLLNKRVTTNQLYRRAERGVPLSDFLYFDCLTKKNAADSKDDLFHRTKTYLEEHHFIHYGDFKEKLEGSYRQWRQVNDSLGTEEGYREFMLSQPQRTSYLSKSDPKSIKMMMDYSAQMSGKNNKAHEPAVCLKLDGTPAKKRGPKRKRVAKVVPQARLSQFGMDCVRIEEQANYNKQMGAVWRWFGVSDV